MSADVVVSLLGPIQVHTPTGWLSIAGTKLQALLALLALAAPHPVSADRLIEELWSDDQPSKPTNALQAQVSQLRRVLGRDVVRRDATGYALAIEADDVDSGRLERLATAGRRAAAHGDHQGAVNDFGTAVGLLRGPPLADLLDHAFAREAATRLDDLAISAHEGLIDAELASGRHADVLPQLAALITAHPLRERFHAQRIVALFRSGRQSDALRAYQDVRTLLGDELGIEPGPELRGLERAVLSHDPALAAPVLLASVTLAAPLPVALTSFVGRKPELVALDDALTAARVVTVVGPAGVGKTRLVLEMAARIAPTQEVWFVDLAQVRDPAGVADAVTNTLGARDRSPVGSLDAGRPPLQLAIERLGTRRVIVVLDNCEHLIDAAAEATEVLISACAELRIVATSREPLSVHGERQVLLGPFEDDDAAALFEARAEVVQPRFRADRAEVAELCRHLDGLPLAIELAAARTKTLPLPEIAARLQDRFGLLVVNARSGSSRQHGLRAAIDWSYDLLFDDERRAFRQLSVFAGGITIEAAQAVCGADALEIVTRLVDKSLLVADISGTASRFRMLESLRAYGLDRLADHDELDDALTAHLAWCTGLAEAAFVGVRGPEQLAWLERLDLEHDNLRAALDEAIRSDPGAGLQLIGDLILPWWFRSRGREARQWVETLLDAAEDPSPRSLAKALIWSGIVADFGGVSDQPGGLQRELELAEQRQRRAITVADQIDDSALAADGRFQLALTLARQAIAGVAMDAEGVAQLIEAAAATYGRSGDDFGVSMVRTVEAVFELTRGTSDACRVAVAAGRAAADRCGNRYVQGRSEWVLGLLATAEGDAATAYRHIEGGLRALDELGMGREVTAQATLLITLATARGEHQLAEQWSTFVGGGAGGLARHDALLQAGALNAEGRRARRSGALEAARSAHLEALALYDAVGATEAVAFTNAFLGFLALEAGDAQGSIDHHAEALRAAALSGGSAPLARALEGVATGFGPGHARWAASLLGAASQLRSTSRAPEVAFHRDDIAIVTARAREELGSEVFDAAFEGGARLSATEALAAASAPPQGSAPP